MFGPTAKYRGIVHDPVDGVPMSWRAHPDGVPVRQGDAPDTLERADLERATVVPFVRSKILEVPRDLEEYVQILDWIANTGAHLRFEKDEPIEPGRWAVWLCWVDVRGAIPKTPGPGMR